MYVCICHAVTDVEIEQAVDAGAGTLDEVGALTTAGLSCAMCHDTIEDIVESRCAQCPLAAMQVA